MTWRLTAQILFFVLVTAGTANALLSGPRRDSFHGTPPGYLYEANWIASLLMHIH